MKLSILVSSARMRSMGGGSSMGDSSEQLSREFRYVIQILFKLSGQLLNEIVAGLFPVPREITPHSLGHFDETCSQGGQRLTHAAMKPNEQQSGDCDLRRTQCGSTTDAVTPS